MKQILPYISTAVMIFGGAYLALMGFKVINPQKRKPEHKERMIQWHKKFGRFAKYGGIALFLWGVLNLVFPDLNAFSSLENPVEQEWTIADKETFKQEMISNSNYLSSMNPDTANLVATCFTEKYSEQYSIQDYVELDGKSSEEIQQIIVPILNECLELFGVK